MAYYAEHNMRGHIRHHASHYAMQKNLNGQVSHSKEWFTAQDFYNGFAAVVGNSLAWGLIALCSYAAYTHYMG